MNHATLASNQYVQDILAQPGALRDTLAALTDRVVLRPFAKWLVNGHLRRIVLTGMGSSYHALYPLMLKTIGRGYEVQRIETAELIYYAPGLLRADTLLIAVSQSGCSAEVLRLLEQILGEVSLIGVTNEADSPLAKQADVVLLTHAGEEHSVSCKTYITALIALDWLGEALINGDPSASRAAFEGVPDLIKQYLAQMEAHINALGICLDGAEHLTLVGRGASLAAVGTGALIVKEAARFPAEGMSSAAFRHGPLEMVAPHHNVLIYVGAEPTIELNLRLARDVKKAQGKVMLVQEQAELEALSMPAAPPASRPILEILPAQMISLALARLHGRQAGQFEHAQKVTTIE
jgi:glucosamine--fructose-6-phosphate aminotransferase (isomerizing)